MPIIYVYLFYGLAFIALGLVMALQARSPFAVLPPGALWLLAAFGFSHGVHEWVLMAVVVQTGNVGDGSLGWLYLGNLFLVAFSFALLVQFGVELQVGVKNWPAWLRIVPAGVMLIWIGAAAAQAWNTPIDPAWIPGADAAARYLLGFPGALLSGYSLFILSREPTGAVAEGRKQVFLAGGAMAFVAYAFFTGLVVPPAPFPPATVLNTETFLSIIGIPVEVFRGISAFAIGVFLSEAFVVETARIRAELERMREEFISVVAHELRSPLTSINLSAGLLDRLPAESHHTDHERKIIDSIRTSVKSLNTMVEDLLDASRLEAKRLALEKERVNLGRLVYEVVDRAAEATKGHPVTVMVPDTVPLVEADPKRVEQILVNLLSNAAKYSYPDTEILLEVEPRPAEVMISVTNYGHGIAPDEQAQLFTRFYRTSSAERAKAAGLGLGLYIVKGLVDAHGGRVWVESEPGRYATFRFTLPCAQS